MVCVTKRMKEIKKLVDVTSAQPLRAAISQIAGLPKVRFDETVELHFNLNLDLKATDQGVRTTVILPHGTGKTVKIIVFCKGLLIEKAKALGVEQVGGEDLIEKVEKGFMDFDCAIATPEMMKELSKLGKLLGPRGLMPSPKAGTVTQDIERAIKEVRAGKIEFKSDKQGGIHVGIGKRSFSLDQLFENATHVLEAVNHAKPAGVKGNLINSLFLSTTMGPGIRITL